MAKKKLNLGKAKEKFSPFNKFKGGAKVSSKPSSPKASPLMKKYGAC